MAKIARLRKSAKMRSATSQFSGGINWYTLPALPEFSSLHQVQQKESLLLRNCFGGTFDRLNIVHVTDVTASNYSIRFYQISASANPESGHFSEIRLRPTTSWICWTPVQLQFVQLIMDKTNAADLSSSVFTILNGITRMKKAHKMIAIPQISSTTGKQWRNKGSTELYCHFIAADSMVDSL